MGLCGGSRFFPCRQHTVGNLDVIFEVATTGLFGTIEVSLERAFFLTCGCAAFFLHFILKLNFEEAIVGY